MLTNSQRGLISGLIYPVQFERDPLDGVDRALEVVVDRRAMGAEREDFAAAVDAALGSDESLAAFIPQQHSEAVIRAYLAELRRRLECGPTSAK
jgi:hypothetical protein